MGEIETVALENLTPNILLLGGGYTLKRLATVLPQNSFVITSRSEEQVKAWIDKGWNAATVSLSDLSSIERLHDLFPSLTTVIDSVPPVHGDSEPAAGVRNFIATLEKSAIKRVLYLSTTGVFGRCDGSWVNEETEPAPSHEGGRARLAVEQLYRASRFHTTCLRLPAINGPGRTLMESLKRGTYRILEDGSRYTNRIHVDDLVEIIRRLIEIDNLPEVLCVSDDQPSRAKDVVAFYCEQLQIPWPPSTTEAELIARGAHSMLSNQRVSNSKIKSLLSLQLRYPTYREQLNSPTEQ